MWKVVETLQNRATIGNNKEFQEEMTTIMEEESNILDNTIELSKLEKFNNNFKS